MPEFQHGGMERLTAEAEPGEVVFVQSLRFDLQEKAFVRAVELVPGEGESERKERGADLMLTARPEDGADQRHVRRYVRFLDEVGYGGFGGLVEARGVGLRRIREDEPFFLADRAGPVVDEESLRVDVSAEIL